MNHISIRFAVRTVHAFGHIATGRGLRGQFHSRRLSYIGRHQDTLTAIMLARLLYMPFLSVSLSSK